MQSGVDHCLFFIPESSIPIFEFDRFLYRYHTAHYIRHPIFCQFEREEVNCDLDEVAGVAGHPVGVFSFPFDIAADGVGARDGYRFMCEHLFKHPIQVIHLHLGGVTWAVDSPACVDKLAVFIEDIEVWGAEGAVGACGILALIVEVFPGESIFCHAFDHMVEGVFGVGVFGVGVDADEGYAAWGVFFDRFPCDLVGA